jgi:hypothetical protein
MTTRIMVLVSVAATLVACGGGGEEVELGLGPAGGADSFSLVNRSGDEWSDVQVRVTGDSGGAACLDRILLIWRPGEAQTLPRCGDRTVVAVTVSGARVELVFANGKLFRKLGRREIPIPS